MNPELTPRLEALVRLTLPGLPTADIACDHAWLAIAFVTTERVPRVIATDLNTTPLERARARVTRLGLGSRIELRQGDGLAPLAPGEVQQVVVAGVGGHLASRVIKDAAKLGVHRLVLQPNRDHERLRRSVAASGWRLLDETLTFSEGRPFVTLAVDTREADDSSSWDAASWRWGPRLIERRDPELRRHLRERIDAGRALVQTLRRGAPAAAVDAKRAELEAMEALLLRLEGGRSGS